MVTLDMIRKPVEGDLEAFEQFIRQKFTADGTLLSEMLDYALSARGKGIRPMTVLLSAALNAPAGQRSGGLRALLAASAWAAPASWPRCRCPTCTPTASRRS